MIIVYITCRDKKEAQRVSGWLLKKKLIACANIFPITSMYVWKKKLKKTGECAVIAKTAKRHYNRIKQEIKKMHSYDVPCILKIKADANREYEKWVLSETR